MNIGEKIRFYREKHGMAKEQLAALLSVDPVTIDSWEASQGEPTAGKIVRLKEIFGISGDELLEDTDFPPHHIPVYPFEVYRFSFSRDDVKKIYRKDILSVVKRFGVLLFILLFFITAKITAPIDREIYGFLYGVLFFSITLFIGSMVRLIKVKRSSEERIIRASYEYRVFQNYFEIFITRNEEPVHSQKVYFNEIEKITASDGFIIISTGTQSFLLKEKELLPDSAFFIFMKNNPLIAVYRNATDGYTLLSLLLFITTLLTPFAAIFIISLITAINENIVRNLWIFFAMLPIPIGSVIFGFILKNKKYRYKKNIAAGCIIAVFLCIYGSFTFFPIPTVSDEELQLTRIENIVDVDFPDPLSTRIFDYSESPQYASRGYIYYQINATFDEYESAAFERGLYYDERWMTAIPGELQAINTGFGGQAFHNTLILNLDTGEYNTLLEEPGTYRFIALGYWQDINQLRVVEYELDYNK